MMIFNRCKYVFQNIPKNYFVDNHGILSVVFLIIYMKLNK